MYCVILHNINNNVIDTIYRAMVDYNSIIESFNDDEIYMMEILGSLSVSPNKNIKINTLKKRVHGKYINNFDATLKSLLTKGLIGNYRNNNICMSREGMIVAKRLYKKKLRDSFRDMSFLLFL